MRSSVALFSVICETGVLFFLESAILIVDIWSRRRRRSERIFASSSLDNGGILSMCVFQLSVAGRSERGRSSQRRWSVIRIDTVIEKH